MKSAKTLYVVDSDEWRRWLERNHDRESEVWLIYYKKHTGKPSIPYDDAVEEALCFGWIDSKVRRIDDEKFMQKYSPRKDNSLWSELNRKRAEKMIGEGRMTRAGLAKIEEAKRNGRWASAYTSKKKLAIPPDLREALMRNKAAYENFEGFANTYQNMYIGWVTSAKREETRKRRIKEVIKRAALNQKPGMM